MEKKNQLRSLFLQKFIEEIFRNIKPASLIETEIIQIQEAKKFEPIKIQREQIKSIAEQIKTKLNPSMHKFRDQIEITSIPIERRPELKQKMRQNIVFFKPLPGNPDIGKLNSLLADLRVQSVECIGPDKNILVKKYGTVQTTSISLTKDEIAKIITDFSIQTRIPVLKGVFRAALGNLTMTAIITDYADNRFVINKSPQQRI